MFNERFFYFIHGIATMFFLLEGLRRLRNKEVSRLNRLCGYVLLYWSLLEFKDLALYPTQIIRYNYLSNLLIIFDITAVPAGCFFVFELLNAGWCTLRRALLFISPFLVTLTTYAFTAAEWIVDVTFIFAGCYTIGFIIKIAYAVKHYNRYLVENFSNTEYIHVRWLKGVMVMLMICLISWTYSCYHSSWIADTLYQLALMIMWATVLFFADRQKPVHITAPLYLSQASSENALATFPIHRLEELMVKEKIWLNSQLTLSDLASQIGTNRTYLSNYLNKTLHTTFYDYINHYRLEAALEHLDNPNSNITIADIAESCGFNSLSTFRRVFMRAKDCTFAEYRQKILSEHGLD